MNGGFRSFNIWEWIHGMSRQRLALNLTNRFSDKVVVWLTPEQVSAWNMKVSIPGLKEYQWHVPLKTKHSRSSSYSSAPQHSSQLP